VFLIDTSQAGSRDGNPWVGAVPSHPRGLFLCAAYTGHGMPNATLCAKAVVEMMLEERNLPPHSSVEMLYQMRTAQEERSGGVGDLPKSYLISQERISRASKLPSVWTQDQMGILGSGLPGI
jgi:hypothetical protein